MVLIPQRFGYESRRLCIVCAKRLQRLCGGGYWRGVFNARRAIQHERLSWEDAVTEAGKWIGTLHLSRNLAGQTIDLTEAAKSLPFEGRFRQMIFESARRKLKKRGAHDVIFPPVDLDPPVSKPTIFLIRPHRGGWQCFEAPGVEPYYTGPNAKEDAISYAKNCRLTHRHGEIRVLNAAGDVVEIIPFDERASGRRLFGMSDDDASGP